jgi:hypothetical protein
MRSPALLLLAACATDAGSVRLSMRAAREGEPLELDGGAAALGGGARAYSALARLTAASVANGAAQAAMPAPAIVDLIAGTVLLEAELEPAGDHTVAIEMSAPQVGSGVDPSGEAAVYVAGLLDGVPFEYRDRAFEPLSLSAAALETHAQEIVVRFDTNEWFEEVELDDLVLTGGRLLLDDMHNAATAAALEARIRASATTAVEDEDDGESDDSHEGTN